jgi:CubicO group peptidase (beta-lactamase class C family)
MTTQPAWSSFSERAKVEARVFVGKLDEGERLPNWDMHALAPAGIVKTCAEDFANFARAQCSPDPGAALTQKPVFKIEEGYWVGLGWHLIERKNGERWLNHGGGMGGYTAIINVNVRRKLAVIVLSNLGNAHELAENVSTLGRELLKGLEAAPSQDRKA